MTALEEHASSKVLPPTEAVNEPAHVKKGFWISQLTADIIAGVSSLAAGGVTAWRLTKELAHRNVSAINYIQDIKENRKIQGPDIANRLEAGELTSEQAYKELQAAIRWNASSVDERMAKGGAGSIWRKFGLLRSHQKWEIAVSALATGGIALGSVLLLSRGIFSEEQERELAKSPKSQPDNGNKNMTM